jgi:DNA-directed RNA polymerase specialized sigma24 family protein
VTAADRELARRVYSYFIFRLRQPEEAERLTHLTFQHAKRSVRRADDEEIELDQRIFSAARAVIAANPRGRGATRIESRKEDDARGISNELALGISRLHARERDAIALRFGAELEVDQISELLDRTPVDVKQRLARGVRSLSDLGVLPGERPASPGSTERARARRAEQREPKQDQARKQR